MNLPELDNLLMEYLDGSLPQERRAAVQKIIENDPDARAALNAYQSLNNLFRAQAPMPSIEWDAMAKQISATIRKSPTA